MNIGNNAEYNADPAQFVSDYMVMLDNPRARSQVSDTAIAEAYIESCLVTDALTDDQLNAEVTRLKPSVAYYRA